MDEALRAAEDRASALSDRVEHAEAALSTARVQADRLRDALRDLKKG